MEYKRLTQGEAENIAIGTKLNFGDGKILAVTGFEERVEKIYRDGGFKEISVKLITCLGEDGKTYKWMSHVLCGATVETMDLTAKKCEYCYKIRPANEIKEGRIRVNYAWHTGQYCFDGPCESYAQMSAEG
jgi:hypothetical protein